MLSIRKRHAAVVSMLLAFALSWPMAASPAVGQKTERAPGASTDTAGTPPVDSTVAAEDKLSGSHLEPLVPETLEGYTLNEVDVKEGSPSVRGVYQSEADDGTISLAIFYGKDAADRYRESRGKISLAASEGKMETGEMTVKEHSVITAQMGSQLIAMAYFSHFLVGVNAKGLDDSEATLVDFLEKVDLDRFAAWSPPDDVEVTLAEKEPVASACIDMECFSERVTQCEEGQLIGALGRRATARYAVDGPAANGQCRLSFVFLDNPNADWENTPLYFTVDPEAGFKMEDVKTVMENCLEGDGEAYGCEGPLLDRVENK